MGFIPPKRIREILSKPTSEWSNNDNIVIKAAEASSTANSEDFDLMDIALAGLVLNGLFRN